MAQLRRREFLKGAGIAVTTAPLAAAGGAGDGAAGRTDELPAGQPVDLALSVNGETQRVRVLPETPLVDALREGCARTGTKRSCGHGACGACTVLVDGTPRVACLSLAVDAPGHAIRTVEGLETDGKLHPVQQAFVDADALQCGFCTPGMVMSGVAFFERYRAAGRTDTPTDTEVGHAIAGNICRCGAQPAIMEAIRCACLGRTAVPPGMRDGVPAGALRRQDAVDKVTGRARYTVDVQLPGMLHGAILRAPHGHAVVKKLDLGPARRMPGVRAVVELLPRASGGWLTVRWAGMEVAAVAADTLAQARAALAAVDVQYDVRPPVVDRAAAERPDAPVIFPRQARGEARKAAEGPSFPHLLYRWDGNVRGSMIWPIDRDNGADVLEQVAAQPVRVDLAAETAVQVHATLEPHAVVAHWEGDRLTVYASTQTTQALASDVADAMDIPVAQVRVLAEHVGGAFGAKAGLKMEGLAAVRLAREAKAPVRIAVPVGDDLTATGNRPGTRHRIRIGADAGGRLRAIHHEGRSYCGAAVGESSTRMTDSLYHADASYRWDANVVTHSAPSVPFRAPGFPPNAFALEQAVDEVAAQLGVDPLTLRLYQERSPRRAAVLRLARAKWDGPPLDRVAADRGRYVRGAGVATADWFVLVGPQCRVEARATRDGHLTLSTATHDVGQGARTALASLGVAGLGLPPARVHVRIGDSALPPAPGTFGSISTNSFAPAALAALDELKDALWDAGARRHPGARRVERGLVTTGGRFLPFQELMAALPEDPYIVLARRPPDRGGLKLPPAPVDRIPLSPIGISQDTTNSVQIAEVEVDRRLGRVRVVRVLAVLDAGRLVAPITSASQVMGGIMQGVSFALYEGRRLDPHTGRNLTRSLESYALLGAADAPQVAVHFLDLPTEHTPHGGAGLGENATIATSGAVANAVFRAIGRRVPRTPLRPQDVLAALA
ncbi:MAG: molybdopterin-dependent oxidoreductase [Deltaproteobacteria bacterium]|nr:molybdopterin-dependent oxidoreductase [Deltaproteobacteria bacterium]